MTVSQVDKLDEGTSWEERSDEIVEEPCTFVATHTIFSHLMDFGG